MLEPPVELSESLPAPPNRVMLEPPLVLTWEPFAAGLDLQVAAAEVFDGVVAGAADDGDA